LFCGLTEEKRYDMIEAIHFKGFLVLKEELSDIINLLGIVISVEKSRRITSLNQIVKYFENQKKPSDDLRVGIEIEKLGVISDSGKAIPYFGDGGIETLLQVMSEKFGWKIVREKGVIIALSRNGVLITLEPGGQLELSSIYYPKIKTLANEFDDYIREIKEIAEFFHIRFLGLGIQPFNRVDEIEWVPKGRYRIMSRYLKERGELGHRMMKQTAAIQATYDYTSEEDAMEKLRVSLGVSSLVTAMLANSPISGGKLNGFMSKRASIWLDTDPERCGLIEKAFSPGFSFKDYVDYIAGLPMMFIKRDDWVPFYKTTFRDYIEKGCEGYFPTVEDFELHLTTIFNEVRIKQYIEVRGGDAPPPRLLLAVPALWKGILYHQGARDAAWKLVKDLRFEERLKLMEDVSRYGLDAKIRDKKVLDFAEELLRISKEGLRKIKEISGEDESSYLSPLEELIFEDRTCPAGLLVKEWEKGLKKDPKKLVEYCSY
jgi:glutamate--cysteine ligase